MLVTEIMTKDVITVSPDASLKDVGELLKEKRISGVPVINEKGNIVGIVTLTDMLRVLDQIYKWQEMERRIPGLKLSEMFAKEKSEAKVRNVMTKTIYTLDENRTIEDVMRMMFDKKVHTIPITKDGKLLGIVGKRDLISACF
jgi:CBS domain-containing protein